ncbi:uncharacterized protein LOC123505642 isoform X1 [Portunus trituberculatus]|uniref:uncharacterized protein LOC123505642 isoform X1 n=1 Tax=Portunus trituberculatus TaxID=210409 RepID=UPI001E1CF02F|nr:uncharacterized protein LOC123505642 isoform X1 [Portunus trituberculatus]
MGVLIAPSLILRKITMIGWKSVRITRVARGGRCGRGGLVILVTGALLCLLLHALTPHPRPLEPRRPLRRIHQEEEDYSGARNSFAVADTQHAHINQTSGAPSSQSHAPPPPAPPSSPPPPPAAATETKKIFPKPSASQHSETQQLHRSQQAVALSALEFGYKLTQQQKKLLQDLTPQGRKELEERTAKTRLAQDRVYLTHLRHKGQIVARRGGGEEIVSLANRTVRFPVLLKKVPLNLWPEQYRVYYNLTHYPWVKSRGCEKFSTVFKAPGSLPPRGLASFPSSGNTWVRYLIEGATGIFTGSMYDDTSLMMKGMYGEWVVHDSGMTVVQKSHGFTTGEAMTLDAKHRMGHNHLEELGHRGVVVIRNPFKALISHRHLDVGGHTGYAPKAHFLGQGWAEFVRLKIRLWRDFYEDWLRSTNASAIYVTHYELLKANPVREMQGILSYLNLPQDTQRLKCLGRNSDGLFKRKPRRNLELDFDPFTEELRGLIYDAIDAVDIALKERGKKGLPVDIYEVYDKAEAEMMKIRSRDGDPFKTFG